MNRNGLVNRVRCVWPVGKVVNTSACHAEEHRFDPGTGRHNKCGYSIVVMLQPSKLKRGVRFSLPAPTVKKNIADVAQLVEQLICNHQVRGSNPCIGTINAGMAKLVDALDLGSSAARRGGSSPSTRTKHLLL
jgi:hypothetical protein